MPLKALLIPRVIISAGNYALLAIVDISYRTVLPVWMSTPIVLGGLGLSPQAIGAILSVYGITNGTLQILTFSRAVDYLGAKKIYVYGMTAALPVFALMPITNLAAREEGLGVTVWSLLALQCFISIAVNFCYGALRPRSISLAAFFLIGCIGSVFIFITASSPNKASLGSVNGLAQMSVSVMRAIGPAMANSIFSLSIDESHHLMGGMFIYLFLACLAVIALGGAMLLPPQVWKDDESSS